MILWRSKFASPDLAYELLHDPSRCIDSMIYYPPLCLQGTVTREKSLGDSLIWEGAFLKMETIPRLTRQAEPKGHATFLDVEHAMTWKERLAVSIKEWPAGPGDLKLKANVQAAGKPGHIYLRWGAMAGDMTASEIGEILETRLQELMKKS